jgi:hypothetical protein
VLLNLHDSAKYRRDAVDALVLAAGPLKEWAPRLIIENGLHETAENMMIEQCEHQDEMCALRMYELLRGISETPEIHATSVTDLTLAVILYHLLWNRAE